MDKHYNFFLAFCHLSDSLILSKLAIKYYIPKKCERMRFMLFEVLKYRLSESLEYILLLSILLIKCLRFFVKQYLHLNSIR